VKEGALAKNAHTPSDCGYNCVYQYEVKLQSRGVHEDYVLWCVRHCQGRWGWYFEHEHGLPDIHEAILTFDDPKDLTFFSLYFIADRTSSS